MKLLKGLLSILNIILIIIIIINILSLISTKILKNAYPSILDFTYYNVLENNNELGIKKGDLIIIDIKKAINMEDLVLYKTNNNYEIGKIIDLNDNAVSIKNKSEKEIKKEDVVGASTTIIPKIGTLLNTILKPVVFITSIIILIITSILQTKISKKVKNKESKPDFNKLKNI